MHKRGKIKKIFLIITLIMITSLFITLFINFSVNMNKENIHAKELSCPATEEKENCRMWGMISDNVSDNVIKYDLLDSPTSLKNLSTTNINGWGIGYYLNYSSSVNISRNATRAYNDLSYDSNVSYLESIKPDIILAHIRACTSGCCNPGGETINNPHPFIKTKNNKSWIFSHNGGVNITNVSTLIGTEYLNENPRTCSEVCADSSNQSCDSEYYFLLLLKYIEENNWNVEDGIVEAVNDLIDAGETGAMIFLLSDGEKLWGYRKPADSYYTLYYLYNNTNSVNNYSTIASRNTTAGWTTIQDRELVRLYSNEQPIVIDTTSYTPTNPEVNLISPEHNDVYSVRSVTFTCNATDDAILSNITLYVWNTTAVYHNNSKNITGTWNETSWSLTNMLNGTYYWNCLAYDNSSHNAWANSNYTLLINLTDETPPYFIDISNQTIYTNQSLGVDFDAADEIAFDTWAINDTTNFEINSTGYLSNITALSVQTYWLDITINDTSNNLNSTIIYVDVSAITLTPSSDVESRGSSIIKINEIDIGKIKKHLWDKITQGQEVTMKIYDNDIGIEEISFTAEQDLSDVSLEVIEIKDISSSTMVPYEKVENVYKYITINSKNIDSQDIKDIKIKFSVANSWLEALEETNISLYRYSGGWNPLNTVFLNKDSDYSYFLAETPGFSDFAIIAELKSGGEIKEEEPEEKIPSTEKNNFEWLFITLLILTALYVLYYFLVYRKQNRKTKKKKSL